MPISLRVRSVRSTCLPGQCRSTSRLFPIPDSPPMYRHRSWPYWPLDKVRVSFRRRSLKTEFNHAEELSRMGAKIKIEDSNAIIEGVPKLPEHLFRRLTYVQEAVCRWPLSPPRKERDLRYGAHLPWIQRFRYKTASSGCVADIGDRSPETLLRETILRSGSRSHNHPSSAILSSVTGRYGA